MAVDKASKMILSPKVKQKALVAAVAVKMAKQLGDPLYEEYVMYREKAKLLKQKIIAKYAGKAIQLLKQRGVTINQVSHQDFQQ